MFSIDRFSLYYYPWCHMCHLLSHAMLCEDIGGDHQAKIWFKIIQM